ncbi:MAG TPA: alcohol dehydrogenase catalytic domain-containing protein [Microlunatus sp.]
MEETPEPHAGPGQVRIRAEVASVNPVDWKFRAGYMAEYVPLEFPAIPGNDAAGTVDEIGEGVSGVSIGDPVFGTTMLGGTAEKVVLAAWAPIPDALTVEQAAGGVGQMAAQIAVAQGLTVIGTARDSNHDFLRSSGVVPTSYGSGLTLPGSAPTSSTA